MYAFGNESNENFCVYFACPHSQFSFSVSPKSFIGHLTKLQYFTDARNI